MVPSQTNNDSASWASSSLCQACHFPDSDVRLSACGCTLHARCVPLCLIALPPNQEGEATSQHASIWTGRTSADSISCPFCPRSGPSTSSNFSPAPIQSIQLFPMSMEWLDQAVECRKKEIAAKRKSKGRNTKNLAHESGRAASSGEVKNEQVLDQALAETSYLLLSSSSAAAAAGSSGAGVTASGGVWAGGELYRTGRWTEEEMALVDFLLHAFDRGLLTLAHGVKLNEFLCDMLLCKPSRLTKKMKNARFSVRTYDMGLCRMNSPPQVLPSTLLADSAPSSSSSSEEGLTSPTDRLDIAMLSSLQEKFLQSITNMTTRLELKFHMTKSWRTHFSNVCLQTGTTLLDAAEWMSSWEQMERRAAAAEELIRKAQRRRMGWALKTDVMLAATPGVFFAGLPVEGLATNHVSSQTSSAASNPTATSTSNSAAPSKASGKSLPAHRTSRSSSVGGDGTHSVSSSEDNTEADFITQMLDLGSQVRNPPSLQQQHAEGANRPSFPAVDDFSMLFSDLIDSAFTTEEMDAMDMSSADPPMETRPGLHSYQGGSYLDHIVSYMEANDLPFQHVDVWVPSYTQSNPNSLTQELRLYHAGHATRADVEPSLLYALHEYGEYSTRFSFAPGVGLPGRVFSTGNPSWERRIDEADPKLFERAGGAKVYGIKTGLGIPFATSVIGRIVVAMYSVDDCVEDAEMIQKFASELASYTPEPKWKLVVEMSGSDAPAKSAASAGSSLLHYNHNATRRQLPVPSLPNQNNGQQIQAATGTTNNETPSDSELEYEMAALLGEFMPMTELASANGPTGASPDLMLPFFMSLRLLLLRPASRRSEEDNSSLDVVKQSYQCYMKQQQASSRSRKELAYLLVRDWQFLQQAGQEGAKRPAAVAAPPPVPAPARDAHQCHVFDVPSGSTTYAMTGAPTKMPTSLTFVDPALVIRRPSSLTEDRAPRGHHHLKRRRVDSSSSPALGSHPTVDVVMDDSPRLPPLARINVVDEDNSA